MVHVAVCVRASCGSTGPLGVSVGGRWLGLKIEVVFKEAPMYIRENRARAGELSVGDDAPNVQVVALDGSSKHVLDHSNKDRPLVVIAGSYS